MAGTFCTKLKKVLKTLVDIIATKAGLLAFAAEAGMAILQKRDEGYALNPQLHPWPPVPKAHATTGKDNLAVEVEARLDGEYRQREQRLIAGGYSDPQWRRIMLKNYGEDYKGMQARAVLRAQEREGERQKLAVGDLGLSAQIASPLDPVTPGAVAGILQQNDFKMLS
jgi:hypothetical protein